MHIQYLLNYLKTLESWIPPSVWEKVPLVKFCWTVLNDFHHCKAIIHYEPQLLALAIIFFGLQVYGITVPCTTEHDQVTWHEVCCLSLDYNISLRKNLANEWWNNFFFFLFVLDFPRKCQERRHLGCRGENNGFLWTRQRPEVIIPYQWRWIVFVREKWNEINTHGNFWNFFL